MSSQRALTVKSRRGLCVVLYMAYPLILLIVNIVAVSQIKIPHSALTDIYCNVAWPLNARYQATLLNYGVSENEIYRVKLTFANANMILFVSLIVNIIFHINNRKAFAASYEIENKSTSTREMMAASLIFFAGLAGLFAFADFSDSKNMYAWNIHRPLSFSLMQASFFMYGMYWMLYEFIGRSFYTLCKRKNSAGMPK